MIKNYLDSIEPRLDRIRYEGSGGPQRLDIDLSLPIKDQSFALTGDFLYVWDAPDSDSYILVRLNEQKEPQHELRLQKGLRLWAFERVFITVPAGQTGTMTLIYAQTDGRDIVIDNRGAVSGTLDEIRGQLEGDTTPEDWGTEKTVGTSAVELLAANADRKGANIQNKSTNGGAVYIGFDNTVTTTKWVFELLPGASLTLSDYRGAIYGIAGAAGYKIGWGEW